MVEGMDLRSGGQPLAGVARLISGLLAVLLLLAVCPTHARAIVCGAEVDKQKIPVGERVTLTVTIEGAFNGRPEVDMPNLPDVEVFGGGTNQNFSFIDGAVQASMVYTFYLRPSQEKNFTIPALSVDVSGQTYQTQPIVIEVLPAGSNSDPARGSGNTAPSSSTPSRRSGRRTSNQERSSQIGPGQPGDDVFITTTVDKEQAYVGEQIVLSFKYFRRSNPFENPTYNPSRTEGFWREDLPPESRYRQTVAGQSYLVTEIKYALFPTRSGDLIIEPAELSFPEDLFSRFFSSRRRHRGPQALRTESVDIKVLPLPGRRPANFSGIVASRVNLTAAVDRDTVPRGEPVGLRVVLDANGFLQSFAGLTLQAPDGIRLHDATDDLQVETNRGRLMSRYTVEKVLVPSHEGLASLDPVSVSYFNPAFGRYEVASSEQVNFYVVPSDLPVVGDEASGFLRSEIARLGHDLAFVHSVTGPLNRRHEPFIAGWRWWTAALMPLLVLLLLRLWLNQRRRLMRDPIGTRRRQALMIAEQVLKEAMRLPEGAARMALIARAITGYVADRTARMPAAMNAADIAEYADSVGCVDGGQKLKRILVFADGLRFGSGTGDKNATTGDGHHDDMTKEVAGLLTALEKAANANQKKYGTKLRSFWLAISMAGLLVAGAGIALAQEGEGLPPAVGAAPGPDPARLVAEGNQAYTDGEIVTALAKYREAHALGVNDAVLHYNLGNAYARLGYLGKAIVCYLRAERLDPRNEDIATNLNWVRSHIRDLELASGKMPPIVEQVYNLLKSISLDQWSIVLLVVLWLAAFQVAWVWYRGVFDDRHRRLLLTGGTLLLMTLTIVGWRYYDEQVRNEAVVVVEEIEVRSGPALTFPVVFKVHDGLTLTWRGERNGWSQVGLGGEWVGWVPAGSVDQVR